MSEINVDKFHKIVGKLTASAASNEACIQFIWENESDCKALFDRMLDDMYRASLNARVKHINLYEYSLGLVGKKQGPEQFNKQIVANLKIILDRAVPVHLYPGCLANVYSTKRFLKELIENRLISVDVYEDCSNLLKHRLSSLTKKGNKVRYPINREEALRRIEDDRERSKKFRAREDACEPNSKLEFRRLWESTKGLEKQDFDNILIWNRLFQKQ